MPSTGRGCRCSTSRTARSSPSSPPPVSTRTASTWWCAPTCIVDHVGWNTTLVDGQWRPTFPRARYLFGQGDIDFWSASSDPMHSPAFEDSVRPVLDAGLVETVAADRTVAPGAAADDTGAYARAHVRLDRGRLRDHRGCGASPGAVRPSGMDGDRRRRSRSRQVRAPGLPGYRRPEEGAGARHAFRRNVGRLRRPRSATATGSKWPDRPRRKPAARPGAVPYCAATAAVTRISPPATLPTMV